MPGEMRLTSSSDLPPQQVYVLVSKKTVFILKFMFSDITVIFEFIFWQT